MSSRNWLVRSLRSRSGLLQWALFLAAIGFVGYMVVKHGDDLKAAFQLTPLLFILISLSSFATFILNGVELKVLAKHFGSDVPLRNTFQIGLAVNTLNYLPMKAGTVLNGIVMRTRYKLQLSAFTALIAASSVIHLWVGLSMAGVALLFGIEQHRWWGWLFLLAPTAGVVILILWGRLRTSGKHEGHESRVVRILARIVDGLGQIFSDWPLLAKEIAINAGLILLWSARSYWAFQSIGVNTTFGIALTVTVLGIVMTRLSIIPGGVGLREIGASFGAKITGLGTSAGFAAAVIERAVMLVWLLIVGVPVTVHLLRSTGVDLADLMGGASGAAAAEAEAEAKLEHDEAGPGANGASR